MELDGGVRAGVLDVVECEEWCVAIMGAETCDEDT